MEDCFIPTAGRRQREWPAAEGMDETLGALMPVATQSRRDLGGAVESLWLP